MESTLEAAFILVSTFFIAGVPSMGPTELYAARAECEQAGEALVRRVTNPAETARDRLVDSAWFVCQEVRGIRGEGR